MAVSLIIFQIFLMIFCFNPLTSAGKCTGRWAIHACGGGNGKRSDIGEREVSARDGGSTRLRDLLVSRGSSRQRVANWHSINPKQFEYGLTNKDLNPPPREVEEDRMKTRSEPVQPIWKDGSLGSVLASDDINGEETSNNDNQELDDALQKVIEKLRMVKSGEDESV